MTRAEVEKLGNKVSLGAYQGHLMSSFTSEGALQSVGAIATFRQGSCPEALESVRQYLEQDFGAPRSLKPHIPLYGGLHQRCHDWRLGVAWLQVCCARYELKKGRPPLMHISVIYGVKGRDTPVAHGGHGEDSLIIPFDGFH